MKLTPSAAGPGGYTGKYGLQPDLLTCGKPLAGGSRSASMDLPRKLRRRSGPNWNRDSSDVGGIGGTLAGNALSIAAMRATLEHVLTPGYVHTAAKHWPIATRRVLWIHQGIRTALDRQTAGFPGGILVPFQTPPHNGGEANAAIDSDLDRFMHLYALNRGIFMTPFHNMALIAAIHRIRCGSVILRFFAKLRQLCLNSHFITRIDSRPGVKEAFMANPNPKPYQSQVWRVNVRTQTFPREPVPALGNTWAGADWWPVFCLTKSRPLVNPLDPITS